MKNRKLVVSTGNTHKLDEIKKMLIDLPIEVVAKNDIGLGGLEVVEDGLTLEDNATKKAKALAAITNFMILADDTGLFVEALGGEPGVFSSRYGGEEGNDQKNKDKLLLALRDIEEANRQAYFRTVMVLITEEKETIKVDGLCSGKIILEEKGKTGFGYDPIFVPEGYDQTFAELGNDIKNKISHRAKALENLRAAIIKMLEE